MRQTKCSSGSHIQSPYDVCQSCQEERLIRVEKMLDTLIRRTAPSEIEIAETIKFREEMTRRQFQGMKP